MERGSIAKWLFFGLAIFLFVQFGWKAIFGNKAAELQPLVIKDYTAPVERIEESLCAIEGKGFRAVLSTKGGSLRHLSFTDEKYDHYVIDHEMHPLDLVSTTRESRMPLRTDLRIPDSPKQQVAYDDLDWKLTAQDAKSCTFTYTDETTTKLQKTVSATGSPYELSVEVKVDNLSTEPLKHRLSVEHTAYRTTHQTAGSLGRTSEFMTETVASTTEKTERQHPDAFEPGDFKAPEFTAEKWRRTPGEAKWVATSNSYFSQIAIPLEGPAKPYAETQIEEYWDAAHFANKDKDPNHGHVYRSRLAYPETELSPQGSATYKVLSFMGPKERDVLRAVGHDVGAVIDLGWFTPIAKILVSYLYVLHGLVGSWGWAICLLTITVRILLFPLSLTQIKSSVAMRRLKPEMDEINEKYKDDTAQRGLALQELWRKNKVANPVMGCIPVLLQMPVWFALYTALQTAVELYHTPFGPFIPDLSAPGKYFIIPVVLGASSFFQQKLMPPQGDPAQQKMLQYMMPGIFTVMMLFLPAGLGVYMLTNTWLGITQQVLAERYLKARVASPSGIEVREKASGVGQGSTPALGKGKARVR